jgi:glycosyltransferase involved in cell wall biosynthesis
MRVLFVLDSLGTGGAERSTADLWYFMRDHQAIIKIVVLGHRKDGIEREILSGGFDVHFLKQTHFWSQVNELGDVCQSFNPDIVHSILLRSNFRVRLLRRKYNFIHVESLVNCSYDPIRLRDPRVGRVSFYVYKWLDKLTTRWVDSFVAITESVRQHYIKELSTSREKICVIYRGRAENPLLEKRSSLRAELLSELKLSEDTLLITHVGRQEFQKGHLVLLEAIRRLDTIVHLPVAFLFLGREGNSSQDIRQFLQINHIKIPLFWFGHRHDVSRFLAVSDIFVFPSMYEGLGGALIEAQAASLPIVCTNIPVLNEVVVNDENAFMFKISNSGQLFDKLLILIQDATLRKKMALASLANYRAKFNLDKVNKQMMNHYQELIK